MDLGEIVLNGNKGEAWVPWKADVDVCLRFLSPADDREMLKKIQKAQFKGHQRTENEIDLVAMRNYFCKKVIKGMRGVTRDGEPFEMGESEFMMLWDGNHEFGMFCVEASREMSNFREEKKT